MDVCILLFIGLAAAIFFLVRCLQKTEKTESQELKFKSTFTKEYEVKLGTLLNWITMTCPAEYSQKFVERPVKKIPAQTIYQYLGIPDSSRNFSKASLADACFAHRNTLMNRLKRIPDFTQKAGITLEQYSSLRVLPPKIFDNILKLHKENFAIA